MVFTFVKSILTRSLDDTGILGINARNLDYLFPSNPRRLYKLADNKLETKAIAQRVGVAVPETYGVVRFQNEVKQLEAMLADHEAFAIKPAGGSGGDGIVVIQSVTEDGYRKASGKLLTLEDLQYHLNNILSGMFSLSGNSDTVIIEYAVQFDPVFTDVAYEGVPDVRVIVYRGVPVMAMLRLPTRLSDGKANLHKGGVGVGINIATGQTTSGIQHNRYITQHPETDKPLQNIAIPHWDAILAMSARLGDETAFGYLGVDFVLDENLGPLLLEMNARPGLSIQIANQEGLIPRLEAVDEVQHKLTDTDEKIAFARRMFGE
ncbi:MAG: alpha-L-glutamate ligase-like protein [Cyanobacteria bacterium J06638_28]